MGKINNLRIETYNKYPSLRYPGTEYRVVMGSRHTNGRCYRLSFPVTSCLTADRHIQYPVAVAAQRAETRLLVPSDRPHRRQTHSSDTSGGRLRSYRAELLTSP